MKDLLFYGLRIVLIGALFGCLAGVYTGITLIASNAYLEQDMLYVAAKLFVATVLNNTGSGALFALGLVAISVVAYPVSRLLRGSWERAIGGAIAAPVVLVALVVIALPVNKDLLPGILELASIVGNLVMLGVAFLVWLMTARICDGLIQKPLTQFTLRLFGTIAIPVIAICFLVAYGALWFTPPSPIIESRPNVFIVMVDTLRADRLGAYGYTRETSPNIDALAAESKMYSQAFSHAPWTKPSVASLFTSMYPRQHGIGSANWNHDGPDDEVTVDTLSYQANTLAELLSNAGYSTIGIGENNHLRSTGFEQGFDSYRLSLDPDEHHTRAPETNQRFFKWLDKHEDDQIFAYIHYIDVHWPYLTPPEFTGVFAGPPHEVNYNALGYLKRHIHDPPETFDPELLRHISDTYDEGILFIDGFVGALLDELRNRDLYDNSMIVFVSDHGEEFREHGNMGHGTSLYDELIHVPLIIKYPCPGKDCSTEKIDRPVELIDIMPTILSYAGISTQAGLFGRDISTLGEQPDEGAFSERGNMVAVRTSDHKFKYSLDVESDELYALHEDPREQHNLFEEYPVLTDQFRTRVLEWMEAVDAGLSVQSGRTTLDDEALKRLEGLGYIQ